MHLAPALLIQVVLRKHFAHPLNRCERGFHFVRDKSHHIIFHLLQFALFRDVRERGDDAERCTCSVIAGTDR